MSESKQEEQRPRKKRKKKPSLFRAMMSEATKPHATDAASAPKLPSPVAFKKLDKI